MALGCCNQSITNNLCHLISGSANIRGSASSILPREDNDSSSIGLDWIEMFEILSTSLLSHLSLFTCYGKSGICNKINGPLNDYELLFECALTCYLDWYLAINFDNNHYAVVLKTSVGYSMICHTDTATLHLA